MSSSLLLLPSRRRQKHRNAELKNVCMLCFRSAFPRQSSANKTVHHPESTFGSSGFIYADGDLKGNCLNWGDAMLDRFKIGVVSWDNVIAPQLFLGVLDGLHNINQGC